MHIKNGSDAKSDDKEESKVNINQTVSPRTREHNTSTHEAKTYHHPERHPTMAIRHHQLILPYSVLTRAIHFLVQSNLTHNTMRTHNLGITILILWVQFPMVPITTMTTTTIWKCNDGWQRRTLGQEWILWNKLLCCIVNMKQVNGQGSSLPLDSSGCFCCRVHTYCITTYNGWSNHRLSAHVKQTEVVCVCDGYMSMKAPSDIVTIWPQNQF